MPLAGGREPARPLAKRRQGAHEAYFGIRLVPVTTGIIRIGDRVELC